MADVLKYFDLCIRQQNAEELRTQLPVLGLGDLPQATLDGLFVRFASVCYEYDSEDCMKVLLEAFNDAYFTGSLDYEAYIFTLRAIPDRVLHYVASHVPESSPAYFLEQLCANPQEAGVLDGIYRCLTLFKSFSFQPSELYALRQRALEQNHTEIADALGVAWSELMPTLARPSWLVVPEIGMILEDTLVDKADALAKDAASVPIPELSLEDALKLALSGMDKLDPERPMAETTLRAIFQSMTTRERYAALQPYHTNIEMFELYEDKEIQRIHGPANPIIGTDLTLPDDECCMYGGCRMLLCTCFEEDAEMEEQRADEWFTGLCDGCDRAISKRWYAVRIPLPGGGWRGCYCSTRCMRPQADTLLETLLLNNLDSQLAEVGIYDRVEAPES
jgi:hypothetical protein